MPRLDVARALDGGPAAYRSGFWGLAAIRRAPVELRLRARLDDGATVEAALPPALAAREAVAPLTMPDVPRVAIAMATCDPDPDLLRRQISSLRAQTFTDWLCVISDDCSAPERFADLQAAVG